MARGVSNGVSILPELVTSAACTILTTTPAGEALVGVAARSVLYGGQGLQSDPSPDAIRRARNTLYALCGAVPDDDDEGINPPQIPGGQCEAEYRVDGSYRIRYTAASDGIERTTNPIAVNGQFTRVNGPVGSLVVTFDENSVDTVLQGNPDVFIGTLGVAATAAAPVDVNLTLSRVDGLPDDCGDGSGGPVPLPPGFDPTVPVDVTVEPPGGGTPGPETWDVRFDPNGPFIGPGGRPWWNGEVCIGTLICIPVSLDLSPDLNVNFGLDVGFGGSSGDPCCPLPRELGPDESPPDNPEDSQIVIKGVRLFLVFDTQTVDADEWSYDAASPPIWVPRLGVLRFAYRGGGGQIFYGPDIDIKSPTAIVYAPEIGDAVGASFMPVRGVVPSIAYLG